MKPIPGNVALAGLLTLALILSGCAGHTGTDANTVSRTSLPGTSLTEATATAGIANGSGGTAVDNAAYPMDGGPGSSGGIGASGTAGTLGSSADMQAERTDVATRQDAPATPPNSTVLAIEVLPAPGGTTESDATTGARGASGAAGSTASGQSYRVTLRLDDGSTQVITHNTPPDFRNGDRVHVRGGAIVR